MLYRTPKSAARAARRGSALLIALVALTTVAAIGAMFLQITASTVGRQVAEVENMRAFYLAEAGLAESFQALRIGRTGQVGSQAAPAVYGNGLLWVDATETVDSQVRLTSTALVGRGRATLALVVEPIEIPLGFFSDEDLVVDEVLLVDGFNSEEATYEEEVGENGTETELQVYASWLVDAMGMEALIGYLETSGPIVSNSVERQTSLTYDEVLEFFNQMTALRQAHQAGTLFTQVETLPIDSDAYQMRLIEGITIMSSVTSAKHTDSGGMIGSNGGILFQPSGERVEIFGNVVPGPEGTVEGLDQAFVSGDTEPRSSLIEFEPVKVPSVTMAASVRHDGLLPMVVAPGTSGHESIEVAAGAELVLRGPATIVIGELTLEPGALLTLDTRDGDVVLYVTGGMDLQPGSEAVTTSDYPDELSVLVGPIATGLGGAPVKLEATSQFHGTIYSPETDVRVGGSFEVYGGIVAKRLEIGPGAKLHFDNARYAGSPIPRVVSWKLVEIPASVRGRRIDPYLALGVEPGTLDSMSEAHDLAMVTLTIEYLDHSGVARNFTGTEDQFDWSQVAEILQLERNATRHKEDPISTDPIEEPVPPVEEPLDIRTDVQGPVDTRTELGMPNDGQNFVDHIIRFVPLTQDEWTAIYGIPEQPSPTNMDRLRQADLAAGGTGG